MTFIKIHLGQQGLIYIIIIFTCQGNLREGENVGDDVGKARWVVCGRNLKKEILCQKLSDFQVSNSASDDREWDIHTTFKATFWRDCTVYLEDPSRLFKCNMPVGGRRAWRWTRCIRCRRIPGWWGSAMRRRVRIRSSGHQITSSLQIHNNLRIEYYHYCIATHTTQLVPRYMGLLEKGRKIVRVKSSTTAWRNFPTRPSVSPTCGRKLLYCLLPFEFAKGFRFWPYVGRTL